MFDSCEKCTLKCCRIGEPPYKPLPFREWYHEAQTYDRYGYKCEWFNEDSGKCEVYLTNGYPIECAIFLCQNRIYSQQELKKIKEYYKVMDG